MTTRPLKAPFNQPYSDPSNLYGELYWGIQSVSGCSSVSSPRFLVYDPGSWNDAQGQHQKLSWAILKGDVAGTFEVETEYALIDETQDPSWFPTDGEFATQFPAQMLDLGSDASGKDWYAVPLTYDYNGTTTKQMLWLTGVDASGVFHGPSSGKISLPGEAFDIFAQTVTGDSHEGTTTYGGVHFLSTRVDNTFRLLYARYGAFNGVGADGGSIICLTIQWDPVNKTLSLVGGQSILNVQDVSIILVAVEETSDGGANIIYEEAAGAIQDQYKVLKVDQDMATTATGTMGNSPTWFLRNDHAYPRYGITVSTDDEIVMCLDQEDTAIEIFRWNFTSGTGGSGALSGEVSDTIKVNIRNRTEVYDFSSMGVIYNFTSVNELQVIRPYMLDGATVRDRDLGYNIRTWDVSDVALPSLMSDTDVEGFDPINDVYFAHDGHPLPYGSYPFASGAEWIFGLPSEGYFGYPINGGLGVELDGQISAGENPGPWTVGYWYGEIREQVFTFDFGTGPRTRRFSFD